MTHLLTLPTVSAPMNRNNSTGLIPGLNGSAFALSVALTAAGIRVTEANASLPVPFSAEMGYYTGATEGAQALTENASEALASSEITRADILGIAARLTGGDVSDMMDL